MENEEVNNEQFSIYIWHHLVGWTPNHIDRPFWLDIQEKGICMQLGENSWITYQPVLLGESSIWLHTD